MRKDIDGAECLEYPLEDDKSVKIVHIIFLDDNLNQFVTQYECEYHSGNGYDGGLRQVSDHVENAGVKFLRRPSDVYGDAVHLCVDGVKKSGKSRHDAVNQSLFDPIVKPAKQPVNRSVPPSFNLQSKTVRTAKALKLCLSNLPLRLRLAA